MDKVKDLLAVLFGGCLVVEGKDRTFAKAPLWLAALCAVTSPQLLVVTVLLCVAFGMKARIDKA